MSGNYSPSNVPTLPGVYSQTTATPRTTLPPSPGSTVALAVTHNWGPVDTPLVLDSFADWESNFGTDDGPGRTAVYGAFNGEGLEGAGGAGSVIVSRLAGASAHTARRTLKNPAAGNALQLDGIFPGTRGNRLNVTVAPINAGTQEIIILDDTAEIASYTYTIADPGALAGLAAVINAVGEWIRATVVLEGATGLAVGTFAFTIGDSGLTLTGADWVSGASQFNNLDFAFFAPYDLPWAQDVGSLSIRDAVNSLVAWTDDQNDAGHRFTLVVGGDLDELPTDAVARALSISNPNVITIGGPGVDDAIFGSLSSSQLAPRWAGIRAQRGEGHAAHFARLAGTVPRPKPDGTQLSLSEITAMVAGGVVALQRDRWTVAPTRAVKDVNTYAPAKDSAEEAARPRKIWGNPKFVMSIQQFANECEAEMEQEMIGKVIVNEATRQAAAARVLRKAKDRERIGAFQPGVVVVPAPGTDDDESITLQVTLKFGRALAQLFLNSSVS